MTDLPSLEALSEALGHAAQAHEDYERVVLKGVFDDAWAGFYAAFAIGRLGDFVAASRLVALLEAAADATDDWPDGAASYVRRKLTV